MFINQSVIFHAFGREFLHYFGKTSLAFVPSAAMQFAKFGAGMEASQQLKHNQRFIPSTKSWLCLKLPIKHAIRNTAGDLHSLPVVWYLQIKPFDSFSWNFYIFKKLLTYFDLALLDAKYFMSPSWAEWVPTRYLAEYPEQLRSMSSPTFRTRRLDLFIND